MSRESAAKARASANASESVNVGLARSSRIESLAEVANTSIDDRTKTSGYLSPDHYPSPSSSRLSTTPSNLSSAASSARSSPSTTTSPLPSLAMNNGATRTSSAESSSTSLLSTTSKNSGFVVTSRKQYIPPRSSVSNPASSSSLTGGSLPLESANSHVPPIASTSSPTNPSPLLNVMNNSAPSTSLSVHHAPAPSAYNSRHASHQPSNSIKRKNSAHSSSRGSSNNGSASALSPDRLTHSPTPTQTTAAESNEPKTTLHLSSSIDAHGRRMVNQYVRLKTIGQGSHGKVWLCAEPVLRESDEEGAGNAEVEDEDERREEDNALFDEDLVAAAARRRSKGKHARSDRWEHEIEAGNVKYCAIKSVAREGAGRGKSLRVAKGRKSASSASGGIGADDKVKREVAIMKRLDHPNIVRLKEVIDDVKSKKVFMVLEFMSGGQIVWQDENKRPMLTVDAARRTFRDVVLGLEYLHYQGIIHRDIKPANLLWNDDHSVVKISDFGVSHVSEALRRASPEALPDSSSSLAPGIDDDKALRKTAGSPAFFAPELCHSTDYTPTPTGGRSPSLEATGESGTYFPAGARASPSLASAFGPSARDLNEDPSMQAPNGLELTPHVISKPLPQSDPTKPRSRAPIGQGIDVWALGVTLYCLLFGDTPFMARTEYELYNVIVKEPIRVPQKMGREGAWTGYGRRFEGADDGLEGREAVNLLARLLEKDPSKRITLREVKKHPWVLRNLSSPDTWLCDTDPAQIESVVITEEDVEHATQERGAVDTLPAIRNRPGIRRALNAALVRFPGFAHMRRREDTASTPRSRSKSGSSNSHSNAEPPTRTPSHSSRHTNDEGGSVSGRKKPSIEFGMDIRRIISRDTSMNGSSSVPRSSSPANLVGRGGWGNFGNRNRQVSGHSNDGVAVAATAPASPATGHNAAAFPALARTASNSSIGANGNGDRRALPGFGFLAPNRKASDSKPESSDRTGTNTPVTELDAAGHRRTLSRMLSKLSGASRDRSNSTASSRLFGRSASMPDENAAVNGVHAVSLEAAIADQIENSGERFDSLGRVVRSRADNLSSQSVNGLTRSRKRSDDDDDDGEEDDTIDLTEFEYSESDDDDDDDLDDDFLASPLAQADNLNGWHSDFTPFSVNLPGENHLYDDGQMIEHGPDHDEMGFRRGKHNPASFKTISDSTPRGSAHHALAHKGLDPGELSFTSPPLIREQSASPSRALTKLNLAVVEAQNARDLSAPTSARDSTLRGTSAGPVPNSRRLDAFADAEEDGDDDDGILMAPRRRRAATVSTVPPQASLA